ATQPTTRPRLMLVNPSADVSPETVAQAIDGDPQLHWKVAAGEATPRAAVFQIKEPVGFDDGTRLHFSILQNYFSAECLGRVRISVTTDADAKVSGVPAEIEQILLTTARDRTPEQIAKVKRQFLMLTPLLAKPQAEIKKMRAT